jgi:hypothetical protein
MKRVYTLHEAATNEDANGYYTRFPLTRLRRFETVRRTIVGMARTTVRATRPMTGAARRTKRPTFRNNPPKKFWDSSIALPSC